MSQLRELSKSEPARGRVRRRSAARRLLIACCAGFLLLPFAASAATVKTKPHALLPPHNPPFSLAVSSGLSDFCALQSTSATACLSRSVAMLNAGRSGEGLGPLMLPSNWRQLNPAQQLFVLTNLERTARGLTPEAGLVPSWNSAAQAGAVAARDPVGPTPSFGSLWAGDLPNSVIVMADWIYADGRFRSGASSNLRCDGAIRSGCWLHRDILLQQAGTRWCGSGCAVGVGYSAGGSSASGNSYTELLGGRSAGQPLTLSWNRERALLPSCERSGDSCSWAGVLVLTTNGVRRVSPRPVAPVISGVAPGLGLRSTVAVGGMVHLVIQLHRRNVRVRVLARRGSSHLRLHSRRLAGDRVVASGRLASGRWRITIAYRFAHRHRYRRRTILLSVPSRP